MTMNVRSQMAFLTVLAVLVAACGPAMERVPDVSPITGEPYPEGVTPRETAETTTATLFLAQAEAAEGQEARDLYRRGLDAALEAVEEDPENPQGYWLAGIGHVGVDEYQEADRMWERSQELYPAYEIEIEPAREMAGYRPSTRASRRTTPVTSTVHVTSGKERPRSSTSTRRHSPTSDSSTRRTVRTSGPSRCSARRSSPSSAR